MILPLLNALYGRFTGDAALAAAFPGGLHRDRAPEGTAMPYVVSHVAATQSLHAYTTPSYRTHTRLRLSAYGVGHDATAAALQTLLAALDDTPLTLSAGTNDTVTRIDDPTPKLHTHDPAGNDVWEWSVTYDYSIVG